MLFEISNRDFTKKKKIFNAIFYFFHATLLSCPMYFISLEILPLHSTCPQHFASDSHQVPNFLPKPALFGFFLGPRLEEKANCPEKAQKCGRGTTAPGSTKNDLNMAPMTQCFFLSYKLIKPTAGSHTNQIYHKP